jgi:hypothetical protein
MGVHFGSDSSGLKGSAAGGGTRRNRALAAVPRWDSPKFSELGAPRVKSTRAWVRGDLCYTCSSSRALAGLGRALSCTHDGGGGSARRRPAFWYLQYTTAYDI